MSRRDRANSHRSAPGARPILALAPALAALLLTACSPDHGATPAAPAGWGSAAPHALTAESEIEQEALRPGTAIDFRIPLVAGDFLQIEVAQHESDLVLELTSPADTLLVRVDRLIGHTGPELLAWVAETSGAHRLRLRAPANTCSNGRFDLRVRALRPARPDDRRYATAFRQLLDADAARRAMPRDSESRGAALPEVIERFEAVREAWRALGALHLVAEAEHRIGSLHRANVELDAARSHFRAALDAARQGQSPFWEMLALHGLAVVLTDLDRVHEAHTALKATLALATRQGNRYRRAQVSQSLAQLAQRQGRIQSALDRASESSALWRACEPRYRARSLHNLAVLNAGPLGRPGAALRPFEQAARAFEQLEDVRSRATVLNQWGQALQSLSRLEAAREPRRRTLEAARAKLTEALRLRQGLKRPCRLAVTRIKLALLDQERGELDAAAGAGAKQRFDAALTHARKALRTIESASCSRDEPTVRLGLGDLHLARHRAAEVARGHPAAELERAEAAYRASLGLYEQRRDRTRMATALTGLAKVSWAGAAHNPGAVQDTLAHGRRGIELVESVRASVVRSDLRSSFFAVVQELFSLTVRALVAAGDARGAFELAEQGRARALRDRLRESGAAIRRHAPPELLQREAELRDELGARIALQRRRLHRGQPADPNLDAAIDAAEAEVEAVHGELRRSSPRHAQLVLPQNVALNRIQDQLDAESLLLETRLGEDVSFLWAVTRDSVAVFELPPRAEIEAQTTVALAWLTTPRPDGHEALCPLSRSVLGPVAGLLRDRGSRLVLVLDGALERLPFAALPIPAEGAETCEDRPLVAGHEIVYLPSAATLLALRDNATDLPPGQLAVFADPVYASDDPRLAEAVRRPPATDGSWKRLAGTGQEADWLRRHGAAERTWQARGFGATKEHVLSGRLRDYRLIHFATHGLVDPGQPGRSHLALSSWDRDGNPIDGTLYAYEIYNLELAAELVTLSACSTGAGNYVPGEGLVSGLARGFLHAGAARVLDSLWDEHDGRTSELMQRIYDGLLDQKLAPARALEQAQVAMWRQGRPAFEWAGFVLQGDWLPLSVTES